MNELSEKLANIETNRLRLEAEEAILFDKAMKSDDPDELVKAYTMYNKVNKKKDSGKSIMFDPFEASSNPGFLERSAKLTYNTLRKMAQVPIIRSIINTRKEQIAAFAQPQSDKYATGFKIRKKKFDQDKEEEAELSSDDKERIEVLTNFVLNCGADQNKWHGDNFDSFVRKIVEDSLTLDQMTFEIVRNRKGLPIEFYATDLSFI